MIISSNTKLSVGERQSGHVTNANCDWCYVAFVVVREATEQEYRLCARENGASENDANMPFFSPHFFYEVAMD